jgi:hypothetical protein
MSSRRQLRARLVDTTEFEDEEFAEAQDSFDDEEEDSGDEEKKVIVECDIGLPKRGLYDETKEQLFDALMENNGFARCNRQNRLVERICDASPNKFGSPGSITRRRIQKMIPKWRQQGLEAIEVRINQKRRSSTKKKTSSTAKSEPRKTPPPLSSPSPLKQKQLFIAEKKKREYITATIQSNMSDRDIAEKFGDYGTFQLCALVIALLTVAVAYLPMQFFRNTNDRHFESPQK